MSLYDKASLIMTPSGVKSAKIYSKKPFNANGDFTFDRSTVATRVNKDGLIETVAIDTPRLNYPFVNGVVQDDPSLLLEPARTNLIPNSFLLSNSPIKNGTITDNFAISPDGTQNASRLTSPSVDPFFYQGITFSTGSYTASIYVKGIGSSIGKELRIVLGANSSAKFTISSEWTRFEYTATMTSGSANSGLEIPDPAVIGDDVLVWGWQTEAGSYATSYIPTSGSTVTRAAETANGAGTSADFNSSEGVLFAEISALADDSTDRYILLSDGGWNNRVQLNFENVSNTIEARFFVNTLPQFDTSFLLTDITTFGKFAIKWKVNDFALWVNGVEVSTDTNGSVPSANTFNELSFYDGQGSNPFYGNTKEIAVFKKALTDTELESLTSWDSFNDMATGQLYSIK